MLARVFYPNGVVKDVKNLGYILRNARDITSITVLCGIETTYECLLVVIFNDGRVYQTDFACAEILQKWLERPALHGRPIMWAARGTIFRSNPVVPNSVYWSGCGAAEVDPGC